MKKGILTALLLASGAALTVYLMNEDQNKKSNNNDDEIKMIKLRSEEESLELVRTIQEIENLPISHLAENLHELEGTSFLNESVIPQDEIQLEELDEIDELDDLTLPSFIQESPLDYVETEEAILDKLTEQSPIQFDEVSDDREEIDLAQFFKGIIDEEEVSVNVGDVQIANVENLELPREEGLPDEVETFDEHKESEVELNSEEDFSKTAIFDLPKAVITSELADDLAQVLDDSMQTNQSTNPLIDFQNDELDEIDLSELLSFAKEEAEKVKVESALNETTEIKLADIEDDEINRLFEPILEDNQVEAKALDQQLITEMDEHTFEEFKKHLIQTEDDGIDLMNFYEAAQSESEVEVSGDHDAAEIQLEDLVFDEVVLPELDKVEVTPVVSGTTDVVEHVEPKVESVFGDESGLEDLELPADFQDEITDAMLEDIHLEDLLEDEALEDEKVLEEVTDTDTKREYPDAIYQISSLYPYLNLKFINAVFANFGAFNDEFQMGSACRIRHKLQFPDSQNLIAFIDIVNGLGYEIEGTDEDQNIVIVLDFINAESKILSEIYNISNQVNCLDGLYRGYELEHND